MTPNLESRVAGSALRGFLAVLPVPPNLEAGRLTAFFQRASAGFQGANGRRDWPDAGPWTDCPVTA
jgi:hypothetical protein